MDNQENSDDDWDPTGYYRRQAEKHTRETEHAVPLLAGIFIGWTLAAVTLQYCVTIWDWLAGFF